MKSTGNTLIPSGSSKNFIDDLSRDIGQAEVAALVAVG